MVQRFSSRLNIPSIYVANRIIPLPENPLFTMIVTGNSEGAADDHICEHILPDDIAITRDIPLAERLVARNITVLNDRGVLFTPENIWERLSLRNFNLALVEIRESAEKTMVYNKRDVGNFANCLDREITRKLKYPSA
ncbi:MAG: DUF188 domain-containing protein [Treponema sp.]|nr:DUF188 domain-containing protein [Treponema sp.]